MRKIENAMVKLYRNRTLKWWAKQQLVTLREISTKHGVSAPAGTQVRVVAKRSGLEVRTDTCPHCGVTFVIAKVPAALFAFAPGYPRNEAR